MFSMYKFRMQQFTFLLLLLLMKPLYAQPYTIIKPCLEEKVLITIYIYDEAGTVNIRQDDRLVDSIKVSLPNTKFKTKTLFCSIGNPVITGSTLSLEMSLFQQTDPVDPRKDLFLKTIIYQGVQTDFIALRRKEAEQIDIPLRSPLDFLGTPSIRMDSLNYSRPDKN
jgi:hypothetical protein